MVNNEANVTESLWGSVVLRVRVVSVPEFAFPVVTLQYL